MNKTSHLFHLCSKYCILKPEAVFTYTCGIAVNNCLCSVLPVHSSHYFPVKPNESVASIRSMFTVMFSDFNSWNILSSQKLFTQELYWRSLYQIMVSWNEELCCEPTALAHLVVSADLLTLLVVHGFWSKVIYCTMYTKYTVNHIPALPFVLSPSVGLAASEKSNFS